MNKEFEKFAKSIGVSTSVVDDVKKSINNSITPYIIEERDLRCTTLDVFSRLLMDRQIFFGSDFNSEACNVVVAELLFLESVNNDDITIMINSPGGSVYDGLAVIDTMNYIKSDVSTMCVGMAASMGAVLLSSGTKGKRFILPHSRVMIHQVSSGMEGKISDLKISLEQASKCQKDTYTILAKQMGKTYEEIEELCKNDNWFHGQEAVDLGIVDAVKVKRV